MIDKKATKQCYSYHRVSTDDQDTENQAQCVSQWIRDNNGERIEQVSEEVSSKVQWQKRELGALLDDMPVGAFLIVSEVSRLARNTLECLEIFKEAAKRNITIVCVKNGLIMDGSMSSKIVSTVLAMAAEIERDMIRARTTEALQRRKAKGLPLGRPTGATSPSKIDRNRAQVLDLMSKKVGISAIARILNVSRETVTRALTKWKDTP